jgi:hypothetical protein
LPRPPHTLVDCLSGCYTDRKNIACSKVIWVIYMCYISCPCRIGL